MLSSQVFSLGLLQLANKFQDQLFSEWEPSETKDIDSPLLTDHTLKNNDEEDEILSKSLKDALKILRDED